MAQQQERGGLRRAAIAGEQPRVGEAALAAVGQGRQGLTPGHAPGGHCGVAAVGQRQVAVEEVAHPGDHRAGACLVQAAAYRAGMLGEHVAAVDGVIQRAPARIGRVQGVAGVVHRHHELGRGDVCDLRVHVFGFDFEIRPLGYQIADGLQEAAVGGRFEGVFDVPFVDLALQLGAAFQQRAVARGETRHQPGEPGPEAVGVDAGVRQGFVLDEVVQHALDPQAGPWQVLLALHLPPPSMVVFFSSLDARRALSALFFSMGAVFRRGVAYALGRRHGRMER